METGEAPWAIPHKMVKRLDQKATEHLLSGAATEPPYSGGMDRAPYVGFAGGGFIVVDAAVWDATGGIPESFAGWGAEDEATAVILDTLAGPHVRLEHDLWHLWHPHARKAGQTHHRYNQALLHLIRSLAGNADAMFELLERLKMGAPLDAVLASGGAALKNAVPMVAMMDFKRGAEVIKRGATFMATLEEAKRHEARPRRIAVRASGAIAQAITSSDRTLEIRSEQHLRNLAARKAAADHSITT